MLVEHYGAEPNIPEFQTPIEEFDLLDLQEQLPERGWSSGKDTNSKIHHTEQYLLRLRAASEFAFRSFDWGATSVAERSYFAERSRNSNSWIEVQKNCLTAIFDPAVERPNNRQ